MSKQSFREKLLEGLARTGMTVADLSRRSGVPYDAIIKLKAREGASTSAEKAEAISKVLGFDMEEPQVAVAVTPGAALIPVYDVAASAGYGALVDAETIAYSLAFPPGYLSHITSSNPRHLAIISVKGDSMAPTLKHDDIVMLDLSKTNLNYDGLFVLRYGEALHVKRVGRSAKPGFITVMSDNRGEYPSVEYALEDVQAIGKVVWYGKKV